MKFKRTDLIAQLKQARAARVARVEQLNKENREAFEVNRKEWFETYRLELTVLGEAVQLALKEKRPLTADMLSGRLRESGGYLPIFKNSKPPKDHAPRTEELDAGIAFLEAASDEEVSINDLTRAGFRVSQWLRNEA